MASTDGAYDQMVVYLITRARRQNAIAALVRESEAALQSETSTETRKQIARAILRAVAKE